MNQRLDPPMASGKPMRRPDDLAAAWLEAVLGTPPLDLEVEPIAHGPLRLESDDGRLVRFPRALCRLRAADGRGGHGWIEWNLNEPPSH